MSRNDWQPPATRTDESENDSNLAYCLKFSVMQPTTDWITNSHTRKTQYDAVQTTKGYFEGSPVRGKEVPIRVSNPNRCTADDELQGASFPNIVRKK